jgi:ubiquitin carboxyl-terminal hydrolase 1
VREEETIPGKGWLRISDDEVEEVGEEALVGSRSQVVMLFYERVGEYAGPERKEGKIQGLGEAEKGREEEERKVREEDYRFGRRTPEGDKDISEG